MRFLFVAPRYHTNQHVIIKTLIDKGNEVLFLASTKGKSEEYSVLEPELMKTSFFSRVLNSLLFKDKDSFFYSRFNIPSMTAAYRLLCQYRPHVLIIRNPNFLPSFFFWCWP